MTQGQPDLLSAGDCPVCSSSGVLALLVSVADGSMLFVCPLCGVAWASPPPENTVDEIVSIEESAPKGLRFPSAVESEAIREAGTPLRQVSFSDWEEDLVQYLVKR